MINDINPQITDLTHSLQSCDCEIVKFTMSLPCLVGSINGSPCLGINLAFKPIGVLISFLEHIKYIFIERYNV